MSKSTITYKGIEFDIEFDYYPEEPMVMYYPDGSGYPGSPAEYEINSITHKGTDFTDFMSEKDYENIQEILENNRLQENEV